MSTIQQTSFKNTTISERIFIRAYLIKLQRRQKCATDMMVINGRGGRKVSTKIK